MYGRHGKTHQSNSDTKAAASPQQAAQSAGDPARLPAWTSAWGNRPSPGLVGSRADLQVGGNSGQAEILQQRLDAGRPLDSEVKRPMEAAFGTTFSQVRVHTDAQAAGLANGVDARAFTIGQDIAFGAGEYRPGTLIGDALIAHELAHVVQQAGDAKLLSERATSNDALEKDADLSAMGVVVSLWSATKGGLAQSAQNVPVALRSGLRLQRCSKGATPAVAAQTREVDQAVTETIVAPPAHRQWSGTYSWQSRFNLQINPTAHTLTTTVRLFSTATDAQKTAWKTAIENKWSNTHTLVVAGAPPSTSTERYPIRVEAEWVNDAARAHYTITPESAGATAGGRAGLGGTTSMTGWGTGDTVDVTHEFGHMLGNPEDYFTTNGRDFTAGGTRSGFRDPGGGIMNNPSENPFAQHYDLIRRQAAVVLGVPESRCTVQ